MAVRFQASNPDRAQRFRHLRAGVGERAEAKVQRHALERVHRAERRSRVARIHRIRQVLHAVVAREHIKEAHDALRSENAPWLRRSRRRRSGKIRQVSCSFSSR